MAYDQVFPTGSGSKLIEVMVRDSTTGGGKTGLAYGSVTFADWREGAATGVTATCVDLTLGTWTTKGWKEVDATNQKGVYQFGVPDLALAAGAAAVTINFQASGMIDKSVRIVLSSPTRGIAAPTALPDAAADAAGGLPTTTKITDARLGALTDWIDAGRLDALLDAVKAKTDLLNFHGTGATAYVKSDIIEINDVAASAATEINANVTKIETVDATDALATAIAAALTAFTGDTGITLPKALEMLAAFVAGVVEASSALGVTTYTYKKRDGSTTSFTSVCNEADGLRANIGALS